MTLLFSIYEYIRNGLPEIKLGEVIFYCGLIVGFSGGIEKLTGKKYIFSWVWSGIKRFISYPYRFNKAHEELINNVSAIKKEVSFNGQTSMRDAVLRIENNQKEIYNSLDEVKFGLQSNLDLLDVPNWKTDADGSVTFLSTSLCQMIGTVPSEMMHKGWVGKIVPEDRKRIVDTWIMSVESGADYDETATYIHGNGKHLVKIRVVGIHHKDANGKVISSAGKFVQIGEPFLINQNLK